MRKLIQPWTIVGTTLILALVGTPCAARAKVFETARALLNSPLDRTGLPKSARDELNRVLDDVDGFGTRLREVLTLDPARISPSTRHHLEILLRTYNLALGMTESDVSAYAETASAINRAKAERDAFDNLPTRARKFLDRLGVTSAHELVGRYTYAELLGETVGQKTFADVVAFAKFAARPWLSARTPGAIIADDVARSRLTPHPRVILDRVGATTAEQFRAMHSVESLRDVLKGAPYLKVLLEYAAAAGHPLFVTEAERLSACETRLDK